MENYIDVSKLDEPDVNPVDLPGAVYGNSGRAALTGPVQATGQVYWHPGPFNEKDEGRHFGFGQEIPKRIEAFF